MTTQATTRFRLDIAYQGTDFNGWALQPGLRTVQGELESALATIFRRYGAPPSLIVAGRTDAGVHAVGQVAHVDLTGEQVAALLKPRGKAVVTDAGTALARRVNGILGPVPDIVVTAAAQAPEGFDARFSALWRRYEYRVADSLSLRDPLQRHRTAWVPTELDVESMDAAALSLLGLHDFASYCKPREGSTTIRTLLGFGWRRDTDGVLVAEVKADAFCHSMVRALVGGCVTVGEDKLGVEDLVTLRDERERTSAFRVMPARGLTLMQVGYPDDIGLAIRAEQTRALRSL
ncbi:tRNA pseudouridine(38-40) synthase TruA [Leifsonia sp. NPDC058230]|uniref:tRNA pseudouridine(38-40) synthase TruA n=1 Tax=Leifsonia sp. NPDC058230 TaxID=3346391 RepID=UPI0036DF63D3